MGRVSAVVRGGLPRGDPLPPDVWNARHRGFVFFLFAQAVGLAIFGVIRGFDVVHSVAEGSIVAMAAIVASIPTLSRHIRAIVATLGLMSASAILVHLSGGTIEAHFHFFVMVTLITLYQEWVPFFLSIAYVVVHHGFVGTMAPDSVYNHAAAIQNPFKWAAVHGAFVLAASIAGLIVWRRNEELREREQLHLQLNQSLNAFSANVAHDLRDPLTVIQGAASTAKASHDKKDISTFLEMIEHQARRGQELVTSLLDLARARGTPRPQSVSLADVLIDVAASFPYLRVERTNLPDRVMVDPVGLRQVLTNLLANADRYARKDDEETVITVSGSEDERGWELVVADSGPGVPAEERASIFEPMTRASNSPGPGAGLGLSIVAAVAESHGGKAWYQPRQGGGSEFWLFFPHAWHAADANAGTMAESATG